MRAFLAKEPAKRFAAQPDRSEGLWQPLILPEVAQCLVCRHVMEPGEEVRVSPGRWVRHPDCVWPSQARGVEIVQS